ncbi:hypothetical protein PR202_gb20477 [Eleusine coracana subsp. coracana]|uniref:RRM domain-containing protein n=1 Tax=Eleusine coracana subsp. coracana TaxID=191504 RepID=A0AAV5FCH8_ELECO|nr:hypothetical protein PR202_gb20477 [Eleusine coracana subsp. coracana]
MNRVGLTAKLAIAGKASASATMGAGEEALGSADFLASDLVSSACKEIMSRRNSRTIYVGNLPGDIREREVEDLFYKYGRILDIDLKIPPRPPGYAFVEFEDPRDADDAIYGRDGYNFDGYKLRVELAHGGRGQSYSYDRSSSYSSGRRGGVSRRSDYRVLVTGLPSSASWQDLKDHMRRAGDVCFSGVYREAGETIGIVDYTNYDDMKYAVDLRDASFIKQAVAPFAQVYHWNTEDRSLARVLVKCIIEGPLKVPRSLVIKTGRELDGEGRSWTIPVYMFNSEILGAAPADEEDPPQHNGNPHPFQGPVVPGEQHMVEQLADHFIQNMEVADQPMQVDLPDQASNADSVTQELMLHPEELVQGPAPTAEVQINPIQPTDQIGSAQLNMVSSQPTVVSHSAGVQLMVPNQQQQMITLVPGQQFNHRQFLAGITQGTIASTIVNNLQRILNSSFIQAQYHTGRTGSSSMVHLTLSVAGLTTTISLPGMITTQQNASTSRDIVMQQEPAHNINQRESSNAVCTANNQIITRVYQRRRVKVKCTTTDKDAQNAPIFLADSSGPARQTPPAKRKAETPISTANLRRTQRKKVLNDGFKASSGPVTRSKAKVAKGPSTRSKTIHSSDGGNCKMRTPSFGGVHGAAPRG